MYVNFWKLIIALANGG